MRAVTSSELLAALEEVHARGLNGENIKKDLKALLPLEAYRTYAQSQIQKRVKELSAPPLTVPLRVERFWKEVRNTRQALKNKRSRKTDAEIRKEADSMRRQLQAEPRLKKWFTASDPDDEQPIEELLATMRATRDEEGNISGLEVPFKVLSPKEYRKKHAIEFFPETAEHDALVTCIQSLRGEDFDEEKGSNNKTSPRTKGGLFSSRRKRSRKTQHDRVAVTYVDSEEVQN